MYFKHFDEIAELTAVNDHGTAYVLAAQLLGNETLTRKFERINREHLRVGYLSGDLVEERYYAYKELMSYAKHVMSDENFKKFYKLF